MEYELHPPQLETFNKKTAGLPSDAQEAIDGVLGVITVAPWQTMPMHESNQDGAYRFTHFNVSSGYGWVTFVVREELRTVCPINVVWYPYDDAST